MAIITVSRGSNSRGKEVAEKVAAKLAYRCISQQAIMVASIISRVPEANLVQAIGEAPSIMDRFTYDKEKYLAYIQAALVRLVRDDKIVYHGPAGHFFLPGISHVLKIRITADMDDRIALVMEREGISMEEAERTIKDRDLERTKWSKYLFGIDTFDTRLYDIVIHIKKITVDDAVEIICKAANTQRFRPTIESQKAMADLFLACEVKAKLVAIKPDVQVRADNGVVILRMSLNPFEEKDLAKQLKETAEAMDGVREVRSEIIRGSPDTF